MKSIPKLAIARYRRPAKLVLMFCLLLLVLTLTAGAQTITPQAIGSKFTPVQLPKPTGKYAVGHTSTVMVDRARVDRLHPDVAPWGSQPRRLPVHFWYPAAPGFAPTRAYVTDKREAEIMTSWQIDNAAGIAGFVKTNTSEEALLAKGTFPLILLSPGYGTGAELYQAYAEELASQGYIVAGVTSPGVSGEVTLDGETYPSPGDLPEDYNAVVALNDTVVQDLQTALQQIKSGQGLPTLKLWKAIDLTKIGACGHSFGGSAALRLTVKSSEVKAAVNLDGTIFGTDYPGNSKAAALFVSTADHLSLDRSLSDAYQKLKGRAYYCVQKDARHNTFFDEYYLLRALYGTVADQSVEELGARPAANILLTRSLLVQFFNAELNGTPRKTLLEFLKNNTWSLNRAGWVSQVK